MTRPYADAALVYRSLGWQGVLPVVGKKDNLPTGFSGRHNRFPTDAEVAQWVELRGGDNLALRLPDGVVGIDVDAHDGKNGAATVEWWEEQLGCELPATWSSTSRGAGLSRIMLYRTSLGNRWVGNLGYNSHVDVVSFHYRYAVTWPSVHPFTRAEYRWYPPYATTASDRPPRADELSELPGEWVDALREGSLSSPRAGRGGHSREDNDALDDRGERVDIARLFRPGGLAEGEQNRELYRYFCSQRARNMDREEMIILGMAALQNLRDYRPNEPWTSEHIIELVDHVRDEHAPGPSGGNVSRAAQAWAQSVAGATVRDPDAQSDEDRRIFTTDLGNTLRLTRVLGRELRYAVDEERWYVWDGRRWAPDRTNRALDLTKRVIDDIRMQAEASDNEDRAGLLTWATQSESLARRNAMLTGAEAEPTLVITADQLDANPDLLVVRNGTLDLRTGQLRDAQHSDLCSRLAEVDYDPHATCARWLGHVNLLCNGDPALAAYLQRAVGYSLTGDVGARSFFFLEGSGSNGKNAFIEPIMMMLGSYAQTATTALLTGGDEQHPTILADLLGARLVFVDETRQGKALNVERVKALTGSKRVKARRMKKDFFEFDAQFKLWIAGNGQPTIRDSSDGTWNRMNRVVCHGKVAPEKRIDRFGDLLYAEEASGILNWALEGLRSWRELGGLGVPESITRDVQSYRDEEDYVGQFLDDVVYRTGDPSDFLPSASIYLEYSLWAAQQGLRGQDLLNASHLARQLASHGLERHKQVVDRVQTRGFRGVAWLRERAR